jgi:capsular exopolysaccharide synthesis family protein
MSHVRNLLHYPAKNGSTATAPVYPVPDTPAADPAPGPHNKSGSTAAATMAPNFPVLANLPVVEARLRPEARLICHTDPRSAAADRFRFLRMRLRDPWSAGKLKKLMIASSLAHDGKSTVTMNLATVLAERGKRSVLVLEADLHHSSLAEILQITPSAGLAECLTGEIEPLSAVRRVDPLGWYLLQAGEPHRNPTELLQTPALGQILQKLAGCFDWILIDSPPVVPITDALLLQQHADASLLVVRAGLTPKDAVEQAVTLLGKKNIVGTVLNGVEGRLSHYDSYYGDPGHDEN